MSASNPLSRPRVYLGGLLYNLVVLHEGSTQRPAIKNDETNQLEKMPRHGMSIVLVHPMGNKTDASDYIYICRSHRDTLQLIILIKLLLRVN